VDETTSPLEERPFAHELGDVLRSAVEQTRAEPPPAHSLARSLERARRLGPGRANPWLRYHRAATAAAVAAVLFLAFALLLICWRYEPGNNPQSVGSGANPPSPAQNGGQGVAVFVDNGPERARPNGLAGAARAEQPFLDAVRNPTSTFPLTVDATAYQNVRRALLEEKRLPSADAVRVAGLVNAFTYSYPEPAKNEAASLTLDLARCPWNTAHHLARIGLRARPDAAVPETEVLVAFNVRRVAAYRLIGYEGRRRRDSDATGEALGAGQVVTALYEIVPASDTDEGEWLTVKMRYQGPNSRLSRSLLGEAKKLSEASADFRFAAAAAEFGLLLRESKYRGDATYDAVRIAARDALGADPDGRRAEFLAMVDAAEKLQAARKLVRRVNGFSQSLRRSASSS
jgi:von Willebrand factor/Uncharacterized protein YfbK, C-terminal